MASFDPFARPSRGEFLARRKVLQRYMEVGQIVAVVVGCVGALGTLVFFMQRGIRPTKDWDGVAFLASFLPFFFVAMFVVKRYGRRFGASCQECKAPLTGVLGQIAVASGRCGKCGAIVCE